MDQKKYAFFDLDHTILPHDTQALFIQYVISREGWRRIYLLWYLPCLIPAAFKIVDLRILKRIFFSSLWKMKEERLRQHASDFVSQVVLKITYPEVVSEIDRLKSEGYTMILNSASPEFYVSKIASHLGFDHFIGTNLIIEKEMPLLPEIIGPNNKREAKIAAMKDRDLIPKDYDWKKDGPFPGSWAFSDSPADIPLLSIAENSVTIHPGSELSSKAEEMGWATMKPERPYRGKIGDKLATFRMALGLGKRFLSPSRRSNPGPS